MSAHFAFEGGEALGDELVKLLHHVGDLRHPNQAIDVKALFSSCEGGFSHDTSSPAMQVPSSGFDRKTHCRKGSGHGHGIEASTAGHPLQFCLRLFLGLRREAKNEAAFSHTDVTMVIFCNQKPCGLFRQGVPRSFGGSVEMERVLHDSHTQASKHWGWGPYAVCLLHVGTTVWSMNMNSATRKELSATLLSSGSSNAGSLHCHT